MTNKKPGRNGPDLDFELRPERWRSGRNRTNSLILLPFLVDKIICFGILLDMETKETFSHTATKETAMTDASRTIENFIKIAKIIIDNAARDVADEESRDDYIPTMDEAMGLAEFCWDSYKHLVTSAPMCTLYMRQTD
jgi:hypothetical protein